MLKCEECGALIKNKALFTKHIRKYHKEKEYYDKWMDEEKEHLCKYCNVNSTEFVSLFKGYKECCCKKHTDLYAYEKRKRSLLKSHGVENAFQLQSSKEKSKKTMLERYGVEHQMHLDKTKEKIKQTYLKTHGVEHNFCKNSVCRKKFEQELYDKHGVKNQFQRKDIIKKIKQTNLEKYGVENPMQREEIFTKSFKTKLLIKKYKNTTVHYQGSFEYDFLKKYEKQFKIGEELINGPRLKYKMNNNKKVYYTDFLLVPHNLIIEIKSTRTIQLQSTEEISLKEQCVYSHGYKFILILNKNYQEFDKWLSQNQIKK